MNIDYNKILKRVGDRVLANVDPEKTSGLMFLNEVATEIMQTSESVDKLLTTFKDVGMPNLMLECPDCASPLLIEFGNCLACGVSTRAPVDAAPQAPPETVKENPESQESTVAEAVEDAELEADTKPKSKVERLKKTTPKKKSEPAPEKTAPVVAKEKPALKVVEPAKKSEIKYPTEKQISDADYAGLKKLAFDYNLATSNKDYKKLSDYRAAIKDEFAQKRAQQAPPVVAEEVVPAKAKKSAKSAKEGKASVGGASGHDGADSKGDVGVRDKAVKGKKASKKKEEDPPPPPPEEEETDKVDEALEDVDSTFDFDEGDESEDIRDADVDLHSEDEEDDDLDFDLDDSDVDDLDEENDDDFEDDDDEEGYF